MTPWTRALQASPSVEFSRQKRWSSLPFPSPGDLPDLGIEPRSPTLQADSSPSEPPGKPIMTYILPIKRQCQRLSNLTKVVWVSVLEIKLSPLLLIVKSVFLLIHFHTIKISQYLAVCVYVSLSIQKRNCCSYL